MHYSVIVHRLQWIGLSLLIFTSGCAAFRPIRGIPAKALGPEMLGESRSNESTIDLSLLSQTPPRQHLVDGGDVLGIYIEGVLGNPNQAPPISVPTNPELPPAIGYPFTVRDDGTLSLPMIGSIPVHGMTIRQVEDTLRRIYTVERQILQPGQDRIIVSLQRPRQVKVLVLRQETGGVGGNQFAQGLSINLGQTKRGSGQVVYLPIYKNDVLHALAQTGGLPGLDAENTIYVVRRRNPHQGMNCPPSGMPGQYGPPTGFGPPPQGFGGPMPLSQNTTKSGGGVILASHQSGNAPRVQTINHQQGGSFRMPPVQIQNLPSSNAGETLRASMQSIDEEPVLRANMQTIEEPVLRSPQQGGPMDLRAPSVPELSDSELRSLQPHSGNYRWGTPGSPSNAPAPITSEETMPEPTFVPRQWSDPASPQMQALPPAGSSYQPPQAAPTPPSYAMPQPRMQPQVPTGQPVMPPQMNYGQMPPQQEWQDPSMAGPVNMPPFLDEIPWDQLPAGVNFDPNDPTMNNHEIIKIPVRLKPGENPHIRPSDVVLQDGDIVFIESRETEIFYTGGLLGGGQYTLPRDYDLDVLGAIAIAQGQNQQAVSRQVGGVSAINGDVTISASNVIILRQLPGGGQIPIKVDLYRALEDPSERVLIQPGDIVMLRYTPLEAVGAFLERNLLESALFGLAASQLQTGGGN
ncbi:polysaccharide biosynthesis/export family protein [Rubinisphaera margarita]|uniref:polysaccharide biosynthesis/export family protein n=1 Tax=Rubinisphaera margarita TaxID=2909586 RepID=UPI001EE7AA81|nr:polysaccharide biosynthesis/export family protein [Rubinisphaera margarita]MCG6157147.1 polysaccharide biosynthesis/export family protein [Rubinisphaera margarita]